MIAGTGESERDGKADIAKPDHGDPLVEARWRHAPGRRPVPAELRCSFQDLLVRLTPARRDRDERLPHCG